jgi:truncated hemoglobin YjbI
MVIEYIRYRVSPEQLAGFESACQEAEKALRAAARCVDYELGRGLDEPDSYVLRVTWTAADGPEVLAALKPYAEETRRYEVTPVAGPGGAAPPSMYDWAGGTDAFIRLCDAFYRRVLADDLLAPLFTHMNAQHARYVALWLAEVFGGPATYTAEHGGYPNMVTHHIDMAITEPQRRRWVNLIMDAADEVELPADPEFRAAFTSYIEWGTRLAMQNSEPGANPTREAPVPHWGWGVAPPYLG